MTSSSGPSEAEAYTIFAESMAPQRRGPGNA